MKKIYIVILMLLHMVLFPGVALAAETPSDEPLRLLFKVGIYASIAGLVLTAIKSPVVKLVGILAFLIGVTMILTQLAIAVKTLNSVL